MSAVARRAEVGIAILARNFPTRADLITATFAANMTAHVDAIETALGDADPLARVLPVRRDRLRDAGR
jgi:AcrR family transcriptional regulator